MDMDLDISRNSKQTIEPMNAVSQEWRNIGIVQNTEYIYQDDICIRLKYKRTVHKILCTFQHFFILITLHSRGTNNYCYLLLLRPGLCIHECLMIRLYNNIKENIDAVIDIIFMARGKLLELPNILSSFIG